MLSWETFSSNKQAGPRLLSYRQIASILQLSHYIKTSWPFNGTNFSSINPRVVFVFGWNWNSGSREEDFKSDVYVFFAIIFPWERGDFFIWTNLNPYTQRWFVPCLFDIGLVVVEKIISNLICINVLSLRDPSFKRNVAQRF